MQTLDIMIPVVWWQTRLSRPLETVEYVEVEMHGEVQCSHPVVHFMLINYII